MSDNTPQPKATPAATPSRAGLRLDVALLVCGLLYILAEFIFNARLLDTASDITATADDLRDVEYLGRAVSGVGLSLLVAGFFARDHFRMSRLSDQIVFGLLAILCPVLFLLSPLSPADGGLDPSGVTFTQLVTGAGPDIQLDFPPPDASMLWIMLPLFGILTVLLAHYHRLHRAVVVAGILMISWPAMFFGQKIIIERFMIHPTSWETRLDARYMQMMRTGFGHGILALRDLRFDEDDDPALRTFLVLMGSLFMQFPEEAKEMIREKENDIVQLVVMRSDIQNIDARYAEYQDIAKEFHERVFLPYEKASSRYADALSEPFLHEARDNALRIARAAIDNGWLKMRDALGHCRAVASKNATTLYMNLLNYNKNFVACRDETCRTRAAINYRRMVRDMVAPRVPFDYWCESSGLDPADVTTAHMLDSNLREIAQRETFACRPESIQRVTERLMPFCTQDIHKHTGFSANVRTREDFANSPTLHKEVRKQLLDVMRREKKLMTFMLPEDWRIDDVATLEDALARGIMSRAGVEWTMGVRRDEDAGLGTSIGMSGMRAGLQLDEFVQTAVVQRQLRGYLGDMYYPGFSMSLTREEFVANVLVPDIKRRAAAYVRETELQGRKFANGESLEAAGKEAVRFIYIPSIALFISLFLVMLTAARCLIMGARLSWRHLYPDARPSPLRLAAAWAAVVVVIASFPYIAGSRTAQSESYQAFLHKSFERAPVTSVVIDWTMRAQPIIYSAGKSLLAAAGAGPALTPRNIDKMAPVVVFDKTRDEMIRAAQEKLIAGKLLESVHGGGIMNEATHEALRSFQKREGLPVTGTLDDETRRALGLASPEK
ncbi:MAG: peptidoglycan-binding domain-containing protein [Alphaproteobacteria bacterium]|nr:peptidoglycan-binding domain-containing protein [Alphaproteobacteria bacterium]